MIKIKENLEWTEINKTTVQVKLSDQKQTVKAKLFFEPSGKLINFTTNDRFFEEKDESVNTNYVRKLWSTSIDSYKRFNGLNLPYEVKAVWHLESEEFCYASFTIEKLIYNISINTLFK